MQVKDIVTPNVISIDAAPGRRRSCALGPETEIDSMCEALEATQDSGWVLSHEGYNVLTESAVESRLALGNGFLGRICASGTK